jgi:two-component system cell cycle sensor histidine kinase/response regulator CckA
MTVPAMPPPRDWWSAESISRFIAALVFAIGAAGIVAVVNWDDRRSVVRDAEEKAVLLFNHDAAAHKNLDSVLASPAVGRDDTRADPGEPDPACVSSNHAVHVIGTEPKAVSGEPYSYKRTAIDARNPANEADAIERDFLTRRSAGAEAEWRGVRNIAGQRWFVLMRSGPPLAGQCLRCHGEPRAAPRQLIERYGAERGFHRREGEVAWAASVRVPLERSLAAANAFSIRLFVVLLGLLSVMYVATTWVNRRLLFKPLAQLREHAVLVAHGQRDVAEQLPLPRGRDLQDLTVAFNEMAARLSAQKEDLERQVHERTHEILERKADYDLLFDQNPMPLWVYDAETLQFLAVNEAAVKHYGYSKDEFLAMELKQIRPPEDVPRLLALQARTRRRDLQTGVRHLKKDGTLIEIEIVSHEVRFLGRRARLVLGSDVTEQRALRAHLQQTQKMEGVGQLAGGVAHDFNNLLTVICSATAMLKGERLSDEGRADLAEVAHAAQRATELTRKLLAFSRKQTMQPRVIQLDDGVRDAEKMLRRLVREDITITTRLHASRGLVLVDPAQMESVLVNLVINAQDAMPNGGTITVETSELQVDDEFAHRDPDLEGGPHVMLAVSDTGVGMPAHVVARAFEPFFTTKEKGRGTGLGLATVYGIVKQSGGLVRLSSEPGRGTTAFVYLPRATEDRATASVSAPEAAAQGGSETVLLVEDEEQVRRVARRVLEAHGYRVLCATNGREALAMTTAAGDEVELVVTDVIMPDMGGPALAEVLRRSRPELPVLFLSGYTGDDLGRNGIVASEVRFLQKPFSPEALARAVRQALDVGERVSRAS